MQRQLSVLTFFKSSATTVTVPPSSPTPTLTSYNALPSTPTLPPATPKCRAMPASDASPTQATKRCRVDVAELPSCHNVYDLIQMKLSFTGIRQAKEKDTLMATKPKTKNKKYKCLIFYCTYCK